MQLMQQSRAKSGLLDRKLECAAAATQVIIERDVKGGGLTRPELAVLMAYAKIALVGEIVASDVPDDPYLSRELRRYFPQARCRSASPTISRITSLRREIIATMLVQQHDQSRRPGLRRLCHGRNTVRAPADIAAAFAVARDSFGFLDVAMRDRRARCEDSRHRCRTGSMPGCSMLLRWTTIWFLRHEELDDGLEQLIARYRDGIAEVEAALEKAVSAGRSGRDGRSAERARQAGRPGGPRSEAGAPPLPAARARHREDRGRTSGAGIKTRSQPFSTGLLLRSRRRTAYRGGAMSSGPAISSNARRSTASRRRSSRPIAPSWRASSPRTADWPSWRETECGALDASLANMRSDPCRASPSTLRARGGAGHASPRSGQRAARRNYSHPDARVPAAVTISMLPLVPTVS